MPTPDRYEFSVPFESALVTRLCASPRLFAKIGRDLDIDLLNTESARLAASAAKAVEKDAGHGPDSTIVVVQRLRRWCHEGKVTAAQIESVSDMMDSAEDAGLPSDEVILAEAVPVLRRRIQHDALMLGMQDHGARRDLDRSIKLLSRASSLGLTEETAGIRFGGDSFKAIDQLKYLDRLPTGVSDLDFKIGNGLPRGQLGVFIGGAGAGKSMALSHVTSYAVMCGLHVAYATLELPEAIVLARMKAAMTGVPIDAIMNDPECARAKLERFRLGPAWVRYFTAQVTTVADIDAWLKQCVEGAKRPIDLLVVDYADKLTDPKMRKEGSSYKTMELVYEGLRLLAVEQQFWAWTASQATRLGKGEKGHRLDLEHAADSQHKVRVADLVITLTVDVDGKEISLFVAKNRTGESRKGTLPLPTAFGYGLLTPTQMPQCGDMTGDPILAAETARLLRDVKVLAPGHGFNSERSKQSENGCRP